MRDLAARIQTVEQRVGLAQQRQGNTHALVLR